MFGTRLEQNNRNTYQRDWETDTVVLSGSRGGGFSLPWISARHRGRCRKNHVGRELRVESLWV